jgi:holo-[acyl-carrier protein] synthase
MIVGLGIDVVVVARWARHLADVETQVFTAQELAACADRVDRIDALAARFAAKEACLKALSAGIARGGLRQVEIVSAAGDAPKLRLSGPLAERARAARVATAHVSLTHHEGIAAAVVILEATKSRRRSAEPWTLETVSSGPW